MDDLYDERTLRLCADIADAVALDRGYDEDVRCAATMIRNQIIMYIIRTLDASHACAIGAAPVEQAVNLNLRAQEKGEK